MTNYQPDLNNNDESNTHIQHDYHHRHSISYVTGNNNLTINAETIEALKNKGNAGQRHPSFLGPDEPKPDPESILNENSYAPEPNITLCGRNLNLTKPQLITLCLLVTYYFMASSYYSLFAPFLPGEAHSKGLNQTQVGMIFGVFQLVLLLLSPFFGKNMETIGIRFLFVSGLFLSSGSQILFGFLKYCPDGFVYFALCIACRTVSGIGSAMGLSYAIVGYYFPNRVSSLVALLELFNGLGLMIGPPIGGFLYEWGGFQMPFFVCGGILFCVFVLAFFIFPDVQNIRKNASGVLLASESATNKASLPFMPLLMNMRFLFTLGMLFAASISIGFIEPSIQIHLMPLELSPSQLGFVLFIPSLLYAITTPIVGCICDRHPHIMPWFMFVSCVASGVSFSFFGPLPMYNLPLKLYIFLMGFIAYGFSIAFSIIPVYSELTKIAIANGYPNDLRTQGLISGAFSSTFSLGSLIGPIVGGVIVDNIGFNSAPLTIVVLFLTMAFFYGSFNLLVWFKKLKKSRSQANAIFNDSEPTSSEASPLLA